MRKALFWVIKGVFLKGIELLNGIKQGWIFKIDMKLTLFKR